MYTAGARVNDWTQKGEWSARKISSRRENYVSGGAKFAFKKGSSSFIQKRESVAKLKVKEKKDGADTGTNPSSQRTGGVGRPKTSQSKK